MRSVSVAYSQYVPLPNDLPSNNPSMQYAISSTLVVCLRETQLIRIAMLHSLLSDGDTLPSRKTNGILVICASSSAISALDAMI